LIPFGSFLLFGFVSIKVVEHWRNRAAFWTILVLLVGAFCWLKRYTFIPPGALLPFGYFMVGMSYVSFRIVHLIIDAYQDSLPEAIGIINYINYTLNFPSLIAGPIQLYPDYLRSQRGTVLDDAAALRAIERIIVGFFKVAIVSPLLLTLHQKTLSEAITSAAVGERAVFAALMLAVYPVYIYINFSGYMDTVIGIARFLRLELPENFNRPFVSRGFIELWGRWHMTLSNWIKTYIYSPLFIGLMHRFPKPSAQPILGVVAYFVAFFFVGVWHGQTASFIFIGVMFGLGVSVNKLYQILMLRQFGRLQYHAICERSIYKAFSRALTFSWFALSSLWFWATWPQLHQIALELGAPGAALATMLLLFGAAPALALLDAMQNWSAREARSQSPLPWSPYVRIVWYTALATLVVSATAILNAPAPHVIYKAF